MPQHLIAKHQRLMKDGLFLDAVASLALGHDCRSHLNCENINELSVLKVENTNRSTNENTNENINENTNERIIEQDH